MYFKNSMNRTRSKHKPMIANQQMFTDCYRTILFKAKNQWTLIHARVSRIKYRVHYSMTLENILEKIEIIEGEINLRNSIKRG